MPRSIITKAGFERAYHRLPPQEKQTADDALRHFARYLETNKAAVGLGIKHLGGKTYEFRTGLALRVVYFLEKDQVILALLGTHDEVRLFLKRS